MTGGVLSMVSTIVNANYTDDADYAEKRRTLNRFCHPEPSEGSHLCTSMRSFSRSAGAALRQDDKSGAVPRLDRAIRAIRAIREIRFPFSWNFHFDATLMGATLRAEEKSA
jgi:hypothetical protein